jgi:CheY-like chemotaxis protein
MCDSQLEPRTILLVEDYDDSRFLMKRLLELRGYRVQEAVDGLEAIRMANEGEPHLILMDLRIPLLDGIEAIRVIRKTKSLQRVPIIIVSGDAQLSREVFLELDELGAGRIEYLGKPFEESELVSLVESMAA